MARKPGMLALFDKPIQCVRMGENQNDPSRAGLREEEIVD
jgi:hypothetical protein